MNLYVKTPNNEVQCLYQGYDAESQVLNFDMFLRIMVDYISYQIAQKEKAERESK